MLMDSRPTIQSMLDTLQQTDHTRAVHCLNMSAAVAIAWSTISGARCISAATLARLGITVAGTVRPQQLHDALASYLVDSDNTRPPTMASQPSNI